MKKPKIVLKIILDGFHHVSKLGYKCHLVEVMGFVVCTVCLYYAVQTFCQFEVNVVLNAIHLR